MQLIAILRDHSSLETPQDRADKDIKTAKQAFYNAYANTYGEVEKLGNILREYCLNVSAVLIKIRDVISEKEFNDFVQSRVCYDFNSLYSVDQDDRMPGSFIDYIQGVEFLGPVSFHRTNFRGLQHFKDCIFHHNVHFNKSVFEDIHFHGCEFRKISNFRQTEFNSLLEFYECTFFMAPSFDGATFNTNSLMFKHCNFKDYKSDMAENNYRILKIASTQKNQEYLTEYFWIKELKARRYTLSKGWLLMERWMWPFNVRTFRVLGPEHIISYIYSAVSDYGSSLLRPFIWIVLLTTLYAINLAMNQTVITHYNKDEPKIVWVENLEKEGQPYMAATYAIKAASGPLRFFTDSHLSVTSWSDKMWGDILSVVCTILWFLGIMSIRRRFRIKNPD